MKPDRSESFVLRVDQCGASLWITVQHLRSGEMRAFASWQAFTRYADPRRSDGRGGADRTNPLSGEEG